MLQISFIRENKAIVIEGLKKKYYENPEQDIELALSLDEKRRNLQVQLDTTLSESKNIAKSIGLLMREGKKEEAEEAKAKTSSLKQQEKDLKEALNQCADELQETLVQFPNVPHTSVPSGKSEDDNEIVFTSDLEVSLSDENKLPHWDLIQKYDIVDFELGNKITGAGFPVYKGKGARLQRALINFFLDEATKEGYTEVQPPIFVNEDSAYATGQLPDKEGQMYHMERDNLYVIPTAEVPITNMYRDVIVKEDELPLKNVGFTPCFRREAGSWGAHVRGLNRLHQFDKVEIVQIQHPDKSYEALEGMKAHVTGLLEKLELPYRVLNLCGGDISFTSALTFDMEVFSAAQERWLEVSSVSNFETFQANRLKLRFKDKNKKSHLLHTLNGSALALPRIMAAILENNQTTEGIKIPAVLVPYTGFDIID
ncbi:MAG: serine--tRNA ligase [Cytophagales bacterium]|nr:serine--tRNA ligase [Cytophagales bacterium]